MGLKGPHPLQLDNLPHVHPKPAVRDLEGMARCCYGGIHVKRKCLSKLKRSWST